MSSSDLNKESLASWDANAAFWDEGIGRNGNLYWTRLQEPSLSRLLHPKTGCRALDLCTGNGLCARWLAERGATVVATDGSPQMLERARARSFGDCEAKGCDIDFRELDVTDGVALGREADVAAGFGGYEIVLMNMAIMDVSTLDPLAAALPALLKKDGVFVATMLHPVFFTSNYSRNIELKFDQVTGDLQVVRTKIIKEYLSIPPVKGIALPGQPEKQVYFHRPFQDVLAPFFNAGLVLDAMEELAFTEEDRDPGRIEASRNYTQLPAIFSFRMRRIK